MKKNKENVETDGRKQHETEHSNRYRTCMRVGEGERPARKEHREEECLGQTREREREKFKVKMACMKGHAREGKLFHVIDKLHVLLLAVVF